jgi:hypothetical protein
MINPSERARPADAGGWDVEVARLAPYLRVLWISLPRDTRRHLAGGAIGPVDPMSAAVRVRPPQNTSVNDYLEAAVDEAAGQFADGGPLSTALQLVLALALWDEEFTAAGLFAGNIYLANEASATSLLSVSGLTPSEQADGGLDSPGALDALLGEMFRAELIYRFPVAVKFRGRFGEDRQFRLNCWGRMLAGRLEQHSANAAPARRARTRIRNHIHDNREEYQAHMIVINDLPAYPVGTAWDSALTLPVGVLS